MIWAIPAVDADLIMYSQKDNEAGIPYNSQPIFSAHDTKHMLSYSDHIAKHCLFSLLLYSVSFIVTLLYIHIIRKEAAQHQAKTRERARKKKLNKHFVSRATC